MVHICHMMGPNLFQPRDLLQVDHIPEPAGHGFGHKLIGDQHPGNGTLLLMLAAAKDYINSEETVFYAVNIEYLLGEDGLIAQLTDAGYTVEQVKE